MREEKYSSDKYNMRMVFIADVEQRSMYDAFQLTCTLLLKTLYHIAQAVFVKWKSKSTASVNSASAYGT